MIDVIGVEGGATMMGGERTDGIAALRARRYGGSSHSADVRQSSCVLALRAGTQAP